MIMQVRVLFQRDQAKTQSRTCTICQSSRCPPDLLKKLKYRVEPDVWVAAECGHVLHFGCVVIHQRERVHQGETVQNVCSRFNKPCPVCRSCDEGWKRLFMNERTECGDSSSPARAQKCPQLDGDDEEEDAEEAPNPQRMISEMRAQLLLARSQREKAEAERRSQIEKLEAERDKLAREKSALEERFTVLREEATRNAALAREAQRLARENERWAATSGQQEAKLQRQAKDLADYRV
jgi:hypothetical protein